MVDMAVDRKVKSSAPYSCRGRTTARRSRSWVKPGYCARKMRSVSKRPIEIELRRGGSVVEKEIVSNADAYARQVDMFSAAIEGNSEFLVPGEEGLKRQNQEVLDAAYRSLNSGKARIRAAHRERSAKKALPEFGSLPCLGITAQCNQVAQSKCFLLYSRRPTVQSPDSNSLFFG